MRIAPVLIGLSLAASASLAARCAHACTSILVAKGAAADGSTLITYAADSHELYGELVVRPATVNPPGTLRDIMEWDTGKFLGRIEQAPRTFAVVGNLNEKQVAIAESTFGGRHELVNPAGTIDYGSLIYIALERAASAREAIRIMTELVEKYGYHSEGESFSISDPREVWLLEMIGKGPGAKGALWVARRVPEGHISAHANQARIRQFPLGDPENSLYAKDVIGFAREKGWFSGRDADFSFAETYAPLDYEALRLCEARVWSIFRRAAPTKDLPIDYVMGKSGAKPLPLWIRPDRKLAVQEVMELMRDHFEGTDLDLAKDLGAGPFHLPYRWRPLTWKIGDVEYLNERAISTQQTGWSMVAQARAWLPDPIGGLLWFGVDDTYSTVYVPMYAGIREAPHAYAPGVASLGRFSWDSAFWVFNWVANFTYTRWDDIIHDVRRVQQGLEGDFLARQDAVEQAALELHRRSPELARDYLTGYSQAQSARTVLRWKTLGEELLVKYLDGNVKNEMGAVTHPPYPDDWYRRIAADTGDRLKVGKLPGAADKPRLVAAGGFFHSLAELGDLAKSVPKDFPFAKEKLLLMKTNGMCQRPPRCCLATEESPAKERRVVVTPPAGDDPCGASDWLLRVPKDDERAIEQADKAP